MEPVEAGWKRESTEFVTRHISLHNDKGFILYSNLTEENADKMIEEEMEYFKSLSQSFEWKLYDYDQPVNLKERLVAKGFTVEDSEALLVLDLNSAATVVEHKIPAEIKPIITEQGIDAIVKLEDEIWGTPHAKLGEQLKRNLTKDPDHLYLYGAYADGKLVSAAWMYLHENTSFGSLWGGSTLPEYRNKGFYTSLLAVRAGQAMKKGYTLLTVDASPMSSPILQKRGFQFLAYTNPCLSPKFE